MTKAEAIAKVIADAKANGAAWARKKEEMRGIYPNLTVIVTVAE